jgi:colanic acid biosynthesis glycosyl transferase WcaI
MTVKILIVSMHYAPEAAGNAPYVTGFAEYLARFGNDVHVLTGMPYYPQWRVHREYRHRMWRREWLNGVAIHRRRQYVPGNPSALRRALSEATHLATGLVGGSKSANVVVGIIPTVADGLLASSIARRSSIPYGLVFQDLVAVGATQSGVASNRVTSLVASLERRMVARATNIGIVTTGFRPHVEALGVPTDRILRLRNWNRLAPPTRGPDEIRLSLHLPPRAIMCLHAGNMGAKQGLQNVIECARLAQVHSPKLCFVLMGDGSERVTLTRLTDRYQLTNVRFLDPQPDGIYAAVLRAADILILNQRHTIVDMALPSKLTAYFAASRPVVAAVHDDSEAALELRAAAAGVTCAPENPVALLKALNGLADYPEFREKLGTNGATYCRDHLDSASVLPEWASFVDRCSRLRDITDASSGGL